ncbi:MAG: hypothetical protein IRY99_26190, partial [Isosphaeraceae bacterium]|nr:hypothetical protein [Isosphaeraceae bacterium]
KALGGATADPKEARRLFRQALAIAADLPEALDGLRRLPPDPPSALRIALEDGRVRLLWNAAPADELGPISYRVVRKRQGLPAHPGDGVQVADVAATECEDPGVPGGETVGYAVFSRRGEVDSLTGASAGPLLIMEEVSDIHAEAHSREVLLSWTPPPGAVGVRVVRKAGARPVGPDDGVPIEALRDQALDKGLEDDRVYQYGLYACYRAPDGTLRTSPGVVVAVMPHRPVEPVDELTVAPEPGGRLRLSWREPPRGQVRVRRTLKPLPLSKGDRLSAAEAEALDGHWLDALAPDHTIDPQPPASGVCSYTPMTAWAGAWTVGQATLYSCVPDPSDLRAVRVGHAGRVHLRWKWSPQGTQTLVLARAGAEPIGPDDPEALRLVVQDVEYSRQGYYALTLPPSPQGPWYVSVYNIAMVEGQRVVSPGLEPTARTTVPGPNPEVIVSYALRPPRFPGRPWSITFRT